MKLSQAATIILTSAVAVGAFVPPSASTHRRISVSTSSYPSTASATGATTKLSPLAMSDSAVMDAETVEEGAETYE